MSIYEIYSILLVHNVRIRSFCKLLMLNKQLRNDLFVLLYSYNKIKFISRTSSKSLDFISNQISNYGLKNRDLKIELGVKSNIKNLQKILEIPQISNLTLSVNNEANNLRMEKFLGLLCEYPNKNFKIKSSGYCINGINKNVYL